MSKHTPGLWKFNGKSQSGKLNFNIIGTHLGGIYKIARVPFNNEYDEKEAEANAKLIAAAPEMLQMLKVISRIENGAFSLKSFQIERLKRDIAKVIDQATQLDNKK